MNRRCATATKCYETPPFVVLSDKRRSTFFFQFFSIALSRIELTTLLRRGEEKVGEEKTNDNRRSAYLNFEYTSEPRSSSHTRFYYYYLCEIFQVFGLPNPSFPLDVRVDVRVARWNRILRSSKPLDHTVAHRVGGIAAAGQTHRNATCKRACLTYVCLTHERYSARIETSVGRCVCIPGVPSTATRSFFFYFFFVGQYRKTRRRGEYKCE